MKIIFKQFDYLKHKIYLLLTHFVDIHCRRPQVTKYITTLNFQENLEMVLRNGKHKLVGFVELGEAHDNMEKILGEIIHSENQAFSGVLV